MKTFIAITIIGALFATGVLKTNVVTVNTKKIATTPCYVAAFEERKNTHETPKKALARCGAEYDVNQMAARAGLEPVFKY